MADVVDRAEIREEGGRARLTVDAPRPLAKAADEPESSYGWQVNYEDPVYNRPADLVDASDSADLRLGAPRLLGPLGEGESKSSTPCLIGGPVPALRKKY